MRQAARVLVLAAAMAGLSSVASGYYYWNFFPSHNGSFAPVQAKYDLTALTGNTVYFFISDQGPSALVPGDSFPALVSEIRAAAQVWNSVATSNLRVAFGGISTVGTPQAAPGIDVVFNDNIPPGLVALTRLTLPSDLSGVAAGTESFVPIQRATIQFYKNLNAAQQASYSDFVFTTMVHEFGHSLGLQHTMTSAVMSTGPTRGTSRAQPLAADDIAGVSLLYPVAGWPATTGTIQGHVLLQSSGVNMASVVALSTNGTVVSTLSNPDGSYQIAGLPAPGQYYVYVHPLPPPQQGETTPANIVYPVDAQQNPFPANTQFDTQFFPGTRDWTQATSLSVSPGTLLDGINFTMQKRSGPVIYAVTTYGYEGQIAVAEPPFPVGTRTRLVLSGPGLATGGAVTSGLAMTAIGSYGTAEAGSVAYYGNFSGYDYLLVTVDANAEQQNGNGTPVATPVALAMTTANDLYVLPAAMSVVATGPPSVTSVVGVTDGQGNPAAVIAGANLSGATRITFDGSPAGIESVNSDGSLTVESPPALGSYNSVVAALAGDGQSSTQALGASTPPVFTYAPQDDPFISVNQPNLAAGTDMTLDIFGSGVSFVDGQVVVGFGSSDIVVKNVWVSTRGRLRLNVSVSPSAQPGPVTLTVISGLQLVTLTATVQIQPFTSGTQTLLAPVTNVQTGLAGVPVGGTAVMGISGLPSNLSGWTLSIGGTATTITQVGANQLQALVPAGASIGLALVQLTSPAGVNLPPILMQIDGPPPVITAILNAAGIPIDSAHAAQAGDTITVGVVASSNTFLPSQLMITVGGVAQTVQSVTPVGQSGAFTLTFVLAALTPVGSQPVLVGIDTEVSSGVAMWVRPADASQQTRR
jgi:hypothetical protein